MGLGHGCLLSDWPDCTNSSVVIDPDRGFEYLKAAKDMKFAQAFYVEGYFRYFGTPPGVKREQTKGLDLIKQAKDLGYPDADTFLATPPTRPPSGCPARY